MCDHKWIFVNGVKVCEKCCQESDDLLELDDTTFTDTHIFMSLVNGGGLVMSGGWNKYSMSSYGKSIQHLCNLNNHNYVNRLLYISTLKIEEIVQHNILPIELIQATMNYFKTIVDIKNVHQKTKRYNIMQLLSSCFFYAAKDLKLNYTHKIVADMFGLTEKHVTKGIKIFNIYMQNQAVISMTKDTSINSIYDMVQHFIQLLDEHSHLNIANDTFFCDYVATIVQKVFQHNIFFKYTHDRIAATVLYYVSQIQSKNITLQMIEQVSNLSPQSLLKSYSVIIGYNKFLIS